MAWYPTDPLTPIVWALRKYEDEDRELICSKKVDRDAGTKESAERLGTSRRQQEAIVDNYIYHICLHTQIISLLSNTDESVPYGTLPKCTAILIKHAVGSRRPVVACCCLFSANYSD